jgi:FAD/FMN-containing dehydrogenase
VIDRRTFLGAGTGAVLASGLTLSAPTPAGARPRPGVTWDRLRASLCGDLVLPGDAAYDRAKQLAAAQFDNIHPRAVAYCENAHDVRTCVLFAQYEDVHAVIRSGGHSFVGWSTTEGLVIDLSRMNAIRPDGGGTLHLGPGAQAVDVVGALAPYGLSVPAGFCPTVCPGGFVTGGGMGWQFRKYGPTSDRLKSAEVVLADGESVTCSEHHREDLLWALRGGGGGNFGVVTRFGIEPTHEPRAVLFTLTWPWDDAVTVISAWQQWQVTTPPATCPRAALLLNDAAPGTPPTVIVTGAHFGEQSEIEALLAELASAIGRPPATKVVRDLTYEQAMMAQFGCENDSIDECHLTGANPEALLPRTQYVHHRSRMFSRAVPRYGVEEMVAAYDLDRRKGQYRWLGFLGLGSNANKVRPGDTTYVHRDAETFVVYTVGLGTPFPAAEELAHATSWVDNAFAAMNPYSNGRTYLNYPDPDLADWAGAYYGENLPRLRSVKRRYDPHEFFRFPHSIRA